MKDRQEEIKHFNRDIYVVRDFFMTADSFRKTIKKLN